ncbi:hypothetical protein FACS1894195_2490 [Bacteroidia bacterium]|nr:hypothetical protein FACS1894195_2490 [Bacteroidia bacterium]
MKKLFLPITILCLSAACVYAVAQPIYVTQTGAGSKNGQGWANAFDDLQVAINAANAGDTIWVAVGTYKPYRRATGLDPYINADANHYPNNNDGAIDSTNRSNTFALKNGVKIYGGFVGDETSLSERWHTPSNAETILSGNIGHPDSISDNCYHVVFSYNVDSSACLDGFTITGGTASGNPSGVADNPDNYGGGIYNYYSSPTLSNLIIVGNAASLRGGGIYNDYSEAKLINVVVIKNETYHSDDSGITGGGAGMYNYNSAPMLTNLSISGNVSKQGASSNPPKGSGIYNEIAYPHLFNTIVWGNTPNGSNVFNPTPSYSIYQNCLVQGIDITAEVFPVNVSGNLDGSDPTNAPLFNADFSLNPCSPAVNAGDSLAYFTARGITSFANERDAWGKVRLSGPYIDMGASEWQIPALKATLREGVCNQFYRDTLTVLSSGSPIEWTVDTTKGHLPAGLTLNYGIISGIPTTIGDSTFTVTTCRGSAIQTLHIVIVADTSATSPTDTIPPPGTVKSVVKGATEIVAGSRQYRVSCDTAQVTITLTTVNPNETILYGGLTNTTAVIRRTVNKDSVGIDTIRYTVQTATGTTPSFLTLENRFHFDDIVRRKYNNSVLLINKKLAHEKSGRLFTDFKWRNSSGDSIGSGEYYAAGNSRTEPLAGAYSVSLSTADGFTLQSCLGNITMPSMSSSLGVYPNPVPKGGTVTLIGLSEDVDNMQLYDLSGRLVDTYPVRAGSASQVMPSTAGIYILQVGGETMKILVE